MYLIKFTTARGAVGNNNNRISDSCIYVMYQTLCRRAALCLQATVVGGHKQLTKQLIYTNNGKK